MTTASGDVFGFGRASWLVLPALLLIALLAPPLLLPLLFVLAMAPLALLAARTQALAPAPVLPALSRPRSPRGPPRS